MVYEEKYVVTNDIPPLQAVGWEGIIILYNKMMLDCTILIIILIYILHISILYYRDMLLTLKLISL